MHIILDTETTGLFPEQGHRICEIGLLPVKDGLALTPWVQRINPERELDAKAAETNGLSWAMLRHEPTFSQIADTLAAMLHGAHLVIHNAPFDVGFLDAEFDRVYPQWPGIGHHAERITCTRAMARARLPGIKHNLNNLCDHYGIDRGDRDVTHHGALIDCQLLAQVHANLLKERTHD